MLIGHSASGKTAYDTAYEAAHETGGGPDALRGRLNVEVDVDACVIGGGLAGLTTARELARRGWSVALLEAGRIGSGASGRNTGFVLPGFASDAATLAERVGLDQARALWRLSEAGAHYVRQTITDTAMQGVAGEAGWLHVSKTSGAAHERSAAFLRGRIGAEVEHWPRAQVQGALRSPLYFDAIHYPRAFAIDPLAYARGLAAAAEAAGVRIFEDTPALEIDPAGVRKRIVTSGARVRASRIVLAGNVGLAALRPDLAATLVPITTYVIATAPLGDRLHQAIAYRGSVSDTEMANNHYRVFDGDRLMWSGRSTMWPRDPRRYQRSLTGDIARAFPQLGPVEVMQCWAGTLGNTVHRMPQVGEIAPGLWLASGFGGHGLNTTAMAGELIARGIAEGDESWRMFSPFDLVWAGGKAGLVTAQVTSWTYAKRERLESWLSRFGTPVPDAPERTTDASDSEPSIVAALPLEDQKAPAAAPPDVNSVSLEQQQNQSLAGDLTVPVKKSRRSGRKSRTKTGKTNKSASVSLDSSAPEQSASDTEDSVAGRG